MRRFGSRFVALALSGMVAGAVLGAAPRPVFAWPGSQTPMKRAALVASGDYPALFGLSREVRRGGGGNALAGMAFSARVRVPLREGEAYPVACFNSMPGSGRNGRHSMVLSIAPQADGTHALAFGRHGGEPTFSVPFPKSLAGKWAHVALSVPQPTGGDAPAALPCLLALDGQAHEGEAANLLADGVAAILLGGPGVGLVGVAIYDRPLGGDFTVRDAARVAVPRAMPPAADPRPFFHWTFGGDPAEDEGQSQRHRLVWLGQPLPAPNGVGSATGCSATQDFPFASGDEATLTVVGKMGRTPGSLLVGFAQGGRGARPAYNRLRLERGDGDAVVLRTDNGNVSFKPIAADVPDASEAFHCYAIRHDHGEISLWVDGVCAGAEQARSADGLTLLAFQVAHPFGGRGEKLRKGADTRGLVVDDLRAYARALTPQEIRALSARLAAGGAPDQARREAPRRAQARPAAKQGPAPIALPRLEEGRALPTEAARREARDLLDELLAGERADGQELLGMVGEAGDDAARFILLSRAEAAFAKAGRHDAAFQVMALRERAFPGAVTDAEAAAFLREALRDTAVKAPDAALANAQTFLAFAQDGDRAALVGVARELTARVDRYLRRAKGYAAWQRTLAKAEQGLKARAQAAKLREEAADGDPAAARRYGVALAKLGRWDDETLGALAICDDRALATLAADETLAVPGDKAAALALGERWWDFAETSEDAALAAACRRHAADLYEAGRAAASGLKRRLVDKRIEEARAE